jgi:hypothetical protein
VRIYRNSEVAYAWSPTPVDHAADGGARKIVVHGVELRRRRLPHLADFDLVLAGADIQIDELALDAASQEQRLVFERRVEATLRGAAPEGTDESSDELRCLRAQLIDPQQVAAACEKSKLPRDLVPDVAAEFKQLRGKSAEAASLLERSLAARFDRLEATILEVTAEAAERRGDKSLSLAGKDLTRAVQDLKRWTSTLRAGAVTVKKRESAASLYAAMTRQLPQSESIFEARRPNPLPAEGEHVLNMRYGDNSQWYGFAGWNGVPMRVKEAVGFDFKATVVVPIVDVIGWRLQWGPSRLSEFRLAVGGLVFQEEDLTTDETDDTVLHVGPQINMSLGTLRVGLAYAANQDQASAGEQLRVLFGADLIKLISGENFEAF